MASGILLPVQEYLETAYEPDAEYVDGVLVERNVGEYDHSKLQTLITVALNAYIKPLRIDVLVEQRVQVAPTRYRVPDICVLGPGAPKTPIIAAPPLAVVEVLSPTDEPADVLAKVADYTRFGIPNIFIVDPRRRKLFRAAGFAIEEESAAVIRIGVGEGQIAVDLASIFSEIPEF